MTSDDTTKHPPAESAEGTPRMVWLSGSCQAMPQSFALHGGGCGERLEVLLAEQLEDRGRAAGDMAEQTAHGIRVLRDDR